MEFKTRATNQTQSPAAPTQPVRTAIAPPKLPWFRNRKIIIWLSVSVAIVLLLSIGGLYVKNQFFSAEAAIQHDKYQALFMSNGQVYFGKLSDIEHEYVKMTDVFYLQTQQSKPEGQTADQSQVTLTKLGSSELHAPEDSMHIAKSQVLFWENLRDDGKVAQAIKEFHKK